MFTSFLGSSQSFIVKGLTGHPAFHPVYLYFPWWDGRGVYAGSCEVETGAVDRKQEARKPAAARFDLRF